MNENRWTATTNTSWIWFDSQNTLKSITGEGGQNISIYVTETSEPTSDVNGSIVITANGKSFTKDIKRCAPSVVGSEKALTFKVSNKSGGNTLGPCDGGTSKV